MVQPTGSSTWAAAAFAEPAECTDVTEGIDGLTTLGVGALRLCGGLSCSSAKRLRCSDIRL